MPSERAAEGSVIVFNPSIAFKFKRERNDSDMFHSSAVSIRPLLVSPFPAPARAREHMYFREYELPPTSELTGAHRHSMPVKRFNATRSTGCPFSKERIKDARNTGSFVTEVIQDRERERRRGQYEERGRGSMKDTPLVFIEWMRSRADERNQRYFCR